MTPVKNKQYRFVPESIVELRERLGFSQADLAHSLGVPPNTVSRWETGATAPDATSLAAIHSVAMESGVTPSFFRKRRMQTVKRTRLLVVWDFPDLATQTQHLPEFDAWLRAECEKRFSTTNQRVFKSFVRANPGFSVYDPTDSLENHDWDVWGENDDLDEKIIHHCKTYCGQDPSRTVLVLVARDGDYADMINELKSRGVRVYLIGFGCSQKLVNAVGENRLIEMPWPSNFALMPFNQSNHPWLQHRVTGWR